MTRFEREVVVRRTRYANDSTGWAVLDADDAEGEHVVLVGPLIHLEEREHAHVTGTWVDDSRYGLQVKVTEARPLAPTDAEAVIAYLRRVRHVGAKRATALVERYGADRAVEVVDDDPRAAFAAVGLGAERGAEAAESWAELRATRQLHLLLAPHGLAYLVGRLHEHYGPGAYRVLRERPYELTSVFGVGFLIADRIARNLAAAPDPAGRIRAAVVHLLNEAERGGSTCLPLERVAADAAELLGQSVPAEEVEALVSAGALVREENWIYRPETAALEAELAEQVRELTGAEPGRRLSAGQSRSRPGGGERELTDEQRDAVENALTHRLSVITGGPGTGKTATIQAITVAASTLGARVLLVAPTGRAAIRMSEAGGVTAVTVHSALGWVPGEGPARDEEDPLPGELLIVDESSMANLELLVTLLRAVSEPMHVVLVGDADQLAPVGAGKPFAELVDSGQVPVTRLTHIFRQAAGSMIVQAAHSIRRGQPPGFAATPEMRRDLFMIERTDPVAAREEIVSLVARRLPDHFGIDPLRDIQVFVPVYRGELGIDALNSALREALNPDGPRVRGGRLRIGDKVMMTGRNLRELGLMNGTVLRLLDELDPSGEEEGALLLAGEDTVFRLPPEEADRLTLAYACSVHRGQGIELPVAVIVAHPAAGAFFLRREMLYTAITRARLATVIVGRREAVAGAVRTADTGRRHSRLAARLLRSESPTP